ncbi:PP2C family protein-serine/threonine phosphatase [Rothia nasimurium]|uniref:PP2C family protein-serine/threonine phosphatase n=1 Tax=Rothia nasimurium TaxID=85336 RepID=UPI001F38A644|nr:protein phosphatase 2C domain-containing protein [Rothia nasimurium]
MNIAFRFAARSDVGRVRSKNDDSGYAGHYLAVVADGMGGHVGGDVASATTVLDLTPLDRTGFDGHASIYLADEIVNANLIMNELVGLNPRLAGMGTTCTALLVDGDRIELAHIGDSRAYRLRDGVFEQITTDHTFVQRLLQEGRISPEEAEAHPHKNVIMRVLGDVDASPELELRTLDAVVGEKWVLSSDGLDAVVQVSEIEAVMRSTGDLQQVVDILTEMTLERGAPDNVTVVALSVIEADSLSAAITAPQPIIPVRKYGEDGKFVGVWPSEVEGQDAAPEGEREGGAPAEPADQEGHHFPWRRRLPQHAKVRHALRHGKWRGESFSDGVLNTMTVRAGVDSSPHPADGEGEDSEPTPASVLRQELAERPHALVGSAVNATQTGMIPAVTARTAQTLATLPATPAENTLEPAELPEEYRVALSSQVPPSPHRWPMRVFVAALTLSVAAASMMSLISWGKSQYFVGVENDRVTVYNGLNQHIGPVHLHTVVEQTDIEAADLPEFSQSLLRSTLRAGSMEEAQQIVQNLREQLPEQGAEGQDGSVQPGSVSTASPTSSASPSASPAPSAGPTHSSSPATEQGGNP